MMFKKKFLRMDIQILRSNNSDQVESQIMVIGTVTNKTMCFSTIKSNLKPYLMSQAIRNFSKES